jgi:dCTP deaminase
MAFWSSQTLEQKLRCLISPFNPSNIREASYTLEIGNEIFVTKDHRNFNDPHTKTILSENQDFVIPPGQFAFLLTNECIRIPKNAIAFISIRAQFKHKGLVNISGFHVDPGFHGNLLFSFYNAGPTPIHLSQGLPFFLIWFADLDHEDSKYRTEQGYKSIPVSVLNQISTDEIYSLQTLTKEFRDVESKVSDKLNQIESIKKEIIFNKRVVWAIVLVIFSIVAFFSSSFISMGKFVLEQKEAIYNLLEYKEVLDTLVDKKNSGELFDVIITEDHSKNVDNK